MSSEHGATVTECQMAGKMVNYKQQIDRNVVKIWANLFGVLPPKPMHTVCDNKNEVFTSARLSCIYYTIYFYHFPRACVCVQFTFFSASATFPVVSFYWSSHPCTAHTSQQPNLILFLVDRLIFNTANWNGDSNASCQCDTWALSSQINLKMAHATRNVMEHGMAVLLPQSFCQTFWCE